MLCVLQSIMTTCVSGCVIIIAPIKGLFNRVGVLPKGKIARKKRQSEMTAVKNAFL